VSKVITELWRRRIEKAGKFITIKADIAVVHKKYNSKLLMKYFIDCTIRKEVLLGVCFMHGMKQNNYVTVRPFDGHTDTVGCHVFCFHATLPPREAHVYE